ncbi:MAG: hypothetical protein M3R60_05085 [Pseudomonadota bacterium]|nr:hypothetical protein [Pseudomonadota bacterium]
MPNGRPPSHWISGPLTTITTIPISSTACTTFDSSRSAGFCGSASGDVARTRHHTRNSRNSIATVPMAMCSLRQKVFSAPRGMSPKYRPIASRVSTNSAPIQ